MGLEPLCERVRSAGAKGGEVFADDLDAAAVAALDDLAEGWLPAGCDASDDSRRGDAHALQPHIDSGKQHIFDRVDPHDRELPRVNVPAFMP